MPNSESLQNLRNKVGRPSKKNSPGSEKHPASLLYVVLCILCILVFIGSSAFGCYSAANRPQEEAAQPTKTPDYYRLDSRTVAEFRPAIIQEFRKESRLEVSTATVTVEVDVHNEALFGWSIFSKEQTLKYTGEGRYCVELADLTGDCVRSDADTLTVFVTIPHPVLDPVEIDPDRFESNDGHKGALAFGDLKFTFEQVNNLEKEVKGQLTKAVDTEENRTMADNYAITELQKILTTAVHSVDSTYTVVVEFAD